MVERIGDLLKRSAHGDAAAFSALYDFLAPGIWRVALALCDNNARASRATEQVFLEIWRAAPLLAAQSGCPLSQLLQIANLVLPVHPTPG